MKKLRYSERFFSIQGEGKHVGVPSVFLRTFGCNFRCQNFGLDRSREKQKYNPEVEQLIAREIHKTTERFEDLPIIHTGCDTYASIYPEFKKFMMDHTVPEVVEQLLALTPSGEFLMENQQDIHLILTGGEPMLGWQRLYPELLSQCVDHGLKNVTIETNGTQPLHDQLRAYLNTETVQVTWSVSPKLSVSGESWDDAIRPEIVKQYSETPGDIYLKFVVADETDVNEVSQAVEQYQAAGIHCPVYLMPLGGRSEQYLMNRGTVAELAMQRGWRYSPRLHVDIFGNEWGT